jgi:hypothetical protein
VSRLRRAQAAGGTIGSLVAKYGDRPETQDERAEGEGRGHERRPVEEGRRMPDSDEAQKADEPHLVNDGLLA